MIKNHPELPRTVDYTDEQESTKTSCNKDTGRRKQLQKWTRGHLFIVRGGGHIERWQPLYQYVISHIFASLYFTEKHACFF